MYLGWLLNPLTAYGLAAAGLMVSLILFVNIRLEIAKIRRQVSDWQDERKAKELEIRAVQEELKSVHLVLDRLEQMPVPRPTGQAINLTKRAQALRMHHRGEAVTSIAAALESPTNEIALLLKVHEMTNEAS